MSRLSVFFRRISKEAKEAIVHVGKASKRALAIAEEVIPDVLEEVLANPEWTDAERRRYAKQVVAKLLIAKYPQYGFLVDLIVGFVFEAIRNAVKR